MKNLPLIIAVIVLLLLAIGGYFYMNRPPSSQNTGTEETATEQTAASAMMSLKDLMMSDKKQTCTFTSSNEAGTVNGTSYISGGKVRTDFSGTYPDGKAYNGGMINDGSYMYSWTTDSDQGFKMALTDDLNKAIEEKKEDFADNPNKYVNPDEKMDYKCSSWNGDTGMFVPPSNIKFTDYSEMMKEVQESTQANPEMKAAQCKACDSAPEGESRTACKQALGCN